MKKYKLKISMLILVVSLFLIFPLKVCATESFSWPTTGWVGWRYLDNNGNHTGIDIWSNQDGGWNSDGSSNPVYAVYPGTLIWEGDIGFIVKHNDNLYTNYWHLKNRQVHPTSSVDSTTLMAYQDMNVTVHLHLTVSTSNSESGKVDPSPYFGLELNMQNSNVIGYLTNHVQSGNGCGGSNIVKSNWNISGPMDCGASNSITITPSSILNPGSGTITLHVP